MYDLVIVTHIPSFYKINLYNELSKTIKIKVYFLAKSTAEIRSNDFISNTTYHFDFEFLSNKDLQRKSSILNSIKLLKLIFGLNFQKIILSGWDHLEYWLLSFMISKTKNCLVLESTINESKLGGLKKYLKSKFMSRISNALVPGTSHSKLTDQLNFKGRSIITGGVGIINPINRDGHTKKFEKKFLFIGRICAEKNLDFICNIFQKNDEASLTIIGDGPMLADLKKKYPKIIFKEKIQNNELSKTFSLYDILILPSISETWGLVIDEALAYGMPVIISKKCGAVDLVENNINGFHIDPYDSEAFENVINSIDEGAFNQLKKNTLRFDINIKNKKHIESYLNCLGQL